MAPAPRYTMDYPVVLETPKGRISGVTLNLSQSGLGLKVPDSSEVPVGSAVTVRLHFQRPGFGDEPPTLSKCELQATVVWRKKGRCGLKILSSEEDARMFYDSLLEGYRALDEFKIAA